jgi:hypothetical protein
MKNIACRFTCRYFFVDVDSLPACVEAVVNTDKDDLMDGGMKEARLDSDLFRGGTGASITLGELSLS